MSYLSEVGEFGFIEKIKEMFPSFSPLLVQGIGDDCAVFKGREGWHNLVTCDVQVEEVHFKMDLFPPFLLGRRILAVNISDVAAMGGLPRFALLSFVLRLDLEEEWLSEVLRGIKAEAERFEVDIIGGNLSRVAGSLVFDVTLIGEVESGHPLLLRSNARVGDLILVTGYPGEAACGLQIILEGSKEEIIRFERLCRRCLAPLPRVEEGRVIAESGYPCALIDVSDGLLQDLSHILEASGAGAVVHLESLPLSEDIQNFAREKAVDPFLPILSGGEDFELLFTAPPQLAEKLKAEIQRRTSTPVWIIGEVVKGKGVQLYRKGEVVSVDYQGWNHFKKDGDLRS
ncbi:MAG: thiamine-phosphate kinase [Candidatus Atribacteria bacterium]|nr:thiamine-phosphate kinase [Candidatus Atribacteria bacterium]MCD6349300.1 thiamine-phosphate kinase [Candidatus Atribacteria bacterium]